LKPAKFRPKFAGQFPPVILTVTMTMSTKRWRLCYFSSFGGGRGEGKYHRISASVLNCSKVVPNKTDNSPYALWRFGRLEWAPANSKQRLGNWNKMVGVRWR